MEEIIQIGGHTVSVVKLLGKGKGGYSWLVREGEREYVLKQIHHEPCDYYTFTDKLQSELRDYEKLRRLGLPIPELLAVDEDKERILKEYIPGDTIYDLILRGGMKSEYLRQVEEMCAVLYAANTNIDYFPTNFVVREGKLWYIDFECNDYMQQWDFQHWGIRYWSKTPEFLEYARQHKT